MILRALIVLMIMLTTIGSAQAYFEAAPLAIASQTEMPAYCQDPPDEDADLGPVHDGDQWTRKSAHEVSSQAWDVASVSFHPLSPRLLEGRMAAPMHRPPIENIVLFSFRPTSRSSLTIA